MKHHLYQIYYGGFKIKIKNFYYCKICDLSNDSPMFDDDSHYRDKAHLKPYKTHRPSNDK